MIHILEINIVSNGTQQSAIHKGQKSEQKQFQESRLPVIRNKPPHHHATEKSERNIDNHKKR